LHFSLLLLFVMFHVVLLHLAFGPWLAEIALLQLLHLRLGLLELVPISQVFDSLRVQGLQPAVGARGGLLVPLVRGKVQSVQLVVLVTLVQSVRSRYPFRERKVGGLVELAVLAIFGNRSVTNRVIWKYPVWFLLFSRMNVLFLVRV